MVFIFYSWVERYCSFSFPDLHLKIFRVGFEALRAPGSALKLAKIHIANFEHVLDFETFLMVQNIRESESRIKSYGPGKLAHFLEDTIANALLKFELHVVNFWRQTA